MRSSSATKKKTRVLVADHEGIFRLGLKRLFAVEDDLRIVAQAEDTPQLLAMAKSFKPDLLFVQSDILGPNAKTVINEVKELAPKGKVVVTASALPGDQAMQFVQSGAAGVILKSVDPLLFVKCARKVMEDEVWLPKQQVAQMAKHLEASPASAPRPADTLTRREKTIISYLMQGWRNREIAQHLTITEQTVKNHLRTIYDKVGVSDRLELVLYAIHQHLDLPAVDTVVAPS